MKKKFTLLVLVFVFGWCSSSGFDAKTIELQSLFIYNFTKHIQWQQVKSIDVFTIGVYNNNQVAGILNKRMGQKSAWGKPIKIVKVSSAEEAAKCQILFLPESNKQKVEAFAAGLSLSNTLVISDYEMIEKGTQICFFERNNKLNFYISKASLEENGLKVSNQLLNLGTVI